MDRRYYLDWIRAFACIFIIIIHTVCSYCEFNLFSIQYFTCLFIEAVVRNGLPLFFMLSGFLLIKEYKDKDSILNFYKKRIKRILPLFIAWSYIYFINNTRELCIFAFFKKFFEGSIINHMWFMYTLIGIYVITPFLSNIIISAKYKNVLIFCIASMCSTTLNPFCHYFGIDAQLAGITPYIWIVYFLTGYCLKNIIQDCNIKNNKIICYYILSCIIIFILSMFTKNSVVPIWDIVDPRPYDFNIFMLVSSASLFIIICKNFNFPLPKIVKFISERSYGIYLSHVIYIQLYYTYFANDIWYINIILSTIFVIILCILTEMLTIKIYKLYCDVINLMYKRLHCLN